MRGDETFAQFLLDAGLVPRAQLAALLEQGRERSEPLSRALVASGLLSEEEVARAQARALAIPFVTLAPGDVAVPALLAIPEALCRAHQLVAYAEEEGALQVALTDLGALPALESLRLPYTLKVRLTDRASMKRALLSYQQALGRQYALNLAAQREPAQIVDALILHALSQGALAAHFEPSGGGLLVRYRIGGSLLDAMHLSTQTPGVISRIKALAHLPDLGSQGRFAVEHEGQRVSVHAHILHRLGGESAVLHFTRGSLYGLGLHGEALEDLYRTLHERSGLVLLCGADEDMAGHLQTLEALLSRRRVVRVEQGGALPATRLRAALHQDPDVLMLADLDAAAAELAVAAANRGMLVIAALRAGSAADGVALLGEAVSAQMLASVLRAAVAVRGVRRLCSKHQRARLGRADVDALERAGANLAAVLGALKADGKIADDAQWKDVPFFAPIACSECRGGFDGHTNVHEVLRSSMALKDLVRAGASAEELSVQARSEGTLSLLEDGIYQAAIGETTVDEVLAALL